MKWHRLFLLVFLAGLAGLLVISSLQLKKRYELEQQKITGIALNLKDIRAGRAAAYTVLTYEEALKPAALSSGIQLVEIKKGRDVKKIKNKKAILFFENNIIFDPETVRAENFTVASVEFEKPAGFDRIPPDRILTLHTIKDKDLPNYNEEETLNRYVRAVLERKICILYLKDPACLERLVQVLKSRGVQLQAAEKNPYRLEGAGFIKNIRFKQAVAFFLALSMPLLGFFTARRLKAGVGLQFMAITAFSLAAAVLISGLLSETVFMLKLSLFTGVKAALLLPPLTVFFFLAREKKEYFSGKVILLLTGAVLSLLVIIVAARSGNYSMPLLPFEKELRDWFEKIFYARPRLKEFLTGHPALLLGLYLYGRSRVYEKRTAVNILAVFLVALGILGQTSMINTFCHVHADLGLSILRTVYGLIIGIFLGVLLILCHKIIRK